MCFSEVEDDSQDGHVLNAEIAVLCHGQWEFGSSGPQPCGVFMRPVAKMCMALHLAVVESGAPYLPEYDVATGGWITSLG